MRQTSNSLEWKHKADFVAEAEKMGLPARIRVYRTHGDMKRAIAMLSRRGYNYFTCFPHAEIDGHRFGLQYCFEKSVKHHIAW